MVDTITPLPLTSLSSIIGIVRKSEQPNIWSTIATSSPTTTGTRSSSPNSSSSSSSSSKFKPLPNPANQFIYLDIPSIATAAGFDNNKGDITNVVIEMITPLSNTNSHQNKNTTKENLPLPRDSSTLYETHTMPFTHGVYAATWFSLAIAGIFLTRLRFQKTIKSTTNTIVNNKRNRRIIGR